MQVNREQRATTKMLLMWTNVTIDHVGRTRGRTLFPALRFAACCESFFFGRVGWGKLLLRSKAI